MKIENYTPHDIVYYPPWGRTIRLKSAGIARCRVKTIEAPDETNGIDGEVYPDGQIACRMVRQEFGAVEGLPEESSGVRYAVSTMVFEASGRHDLIVPTETFQGAGGKIIGCRAFRCR